MEHKIIDFKAYRRYFDESKLWAKLKSVARKAGIKVAYYALVLYYLARDNQVPMADKLKIYGALGYFILPTDMIPDAILGLGFTDDLAALAWAVYSVGRLITPEHQQRAREKLEEWFGTVDESQIAGLLPPPSPDVTSAE